MNDYLLRENVFNFKYLGKGVEGWFEAKSMIEIGFEDYNKWFI